VGRKKRKAAGEPSVAAKQQPSARLDPVNRSAFDRVDPRNAPPFRTEAPRPIATPKPPRRRRRPEETERLVHGIFMVLVGLLAFFLLRMVAGQNEEARKKIEHVRSTFRPTLCTIEGIQTMSGNKVGRRANYEYSLVVDGRGFRATGYAPDGPKSGRTDEELRNAFPGVHASRVSTIRPRRRPPT
jgi:hypothetical protein